MTNIKNTILRKKNLLIAGALVAILAIGSTFAFFVDRDSVTNNFTVGDVEIDVEEPNWNPDDGESITPNKVIKKDPLVKNVGANDAYAFISVTVPRSNVVTANADGSLNDAKTQDLFTYAANKGWKLIKTATQDSYSEYIYAYADDEGKMTTLKAGESTGTLFDTVKFINLVEDQIEGENLDINVNAMAIQVDDLGTTDPLEIYNIIMNQQDTTDNV